MREPVSPNGESQGLYIHIPFCDGKCIYCAFYSECYRPELADRYLSALDRELSWAAESYPHFKPATIYIGGGTPTILTPVQLERLLQIVRRFAGARSLSEWTVEANPGSLKAETLALLKTAGVNRISLGVQNFDDRILRRLGRRHALREIEDAIRLLKEARWANWGMDLIACVPGVTRREWQSVLEQAVCYGPSHISVYALTVEEGTQLMRLAGKRGHRLLSPAGEVKMLELTRTILTGAGFQHYEISNYARPGYGCRHNLACWRGNEYLGVGAAAASRMGSMRWINRPDISAYLEAVEHGVPPPADYEQRDPHRAAQEDMVFGLRMAEGIHLPTIVRRHGLENDSKADAWEEALERMAKHGLVEKHRQRWRLTRRGHYLADAVGRELMD